jgi:hypothetical protein
MKNRKKFTIKKMNGYVNITWPEHPKIMFLDYLFKKRLPAKKDYYTTTEYKIKKYHIERKGDVYIWEEDSQGYGYEKRIFNVDYKIWLRPEKRMGLRTF